MGPDRYRWLTPSAPGAIAIVRLPALDAAFDRPLPPLGQARFARMLDRDGRTVDEVVIAHISAGMCEMTCHGGAGVHAAIDACLRGHALRECADGDDPLWSALAAATSPAAAVWLLRHGTATPSFPAEFLRRKPIVLITGPANAGKSTLLNAWCGHQRALVSDQPGTTRDLVGADALVHGWRLRLIDSAGARATADPMETAGQELVERARSEADLVLALSPFGAAANARPGELIVTGKADLGAAEGLLWSIHGVTIAGRRIDSRDLLDRLGRAILERLGLPVMN
jgi:tRNA U34 5-carboxymethylaminomethyl modifying GTPase MnmE/TrmE